MRGFKRVAIWVAMAVVGTGGVAQQAMASSQFADTVTGGWGGERAALQSKGIDLGAVYTGEFAGNFDGGTRHTGSFAGDMLLTGGFDFNKLFGWRGGSFQVILDNRNGHLLNERAGMDTTVPASVQEVSGTGNVTRVIDFYLQQDFWGQSLYVRLGRIDASQDFFSFACNFQNLTFCANLPSYMTDDVPAWPYSALGVTLGIQPESTWYLHIGAFKNNPNNFTNANGVRIVPNGPNVGTTFMAEFGINTSIAASDPKSPLTGTWAIGGWHDNAPRPDLLLDVNDVPQAITGASPLTRTHTSGMYVYGTQEIAQNRNGGAISLFANFIRADDHTDEVSAMTSVGLIDNGPFASRPNDSIHVAIGENHISGQLADAVRIANAIGHDAGPVPDNEYVFELDYSAQVWRGVDLMPNLQYIKDPSGLHGIGNIAVFGLQFTVTM